MRRALSVLLLALVLSACGFANGGWRARDTAGEVMLATTMALDWDQTTWVVAHCNETNPIIGTCGEGIPPYIWFPEVFLVHLAVGLALPPDWRSAWQAAIIGAETNQVWGNWSEGVPW